MDKKGQGLPITTIIIAILGLVVLIILFAILTGRLTIFAGVASECPGVCVLEDDKSWYEYSYYENKGILEIVHAGGLRTEAECNEITEKRMYGRYIARIRTSEDEPIPCKICCQRLG